MIDVRDVQRVLDARTALWHVTPPAVPSRLVTIRPEIVARAGANDPSPLVARLARRKSALPLRILTLAVLLDAELSQDVRDFVRPKEYRRWLGIEAGSGHSPAGHTSQEPDGYKRMSRALQILEQERRAWVEELRVTAKARRMGARRRAARAKLDARLWTDLWYLGAAKGELAWVLAKGVPGPNPRADVRVDRFDLTRNVNGLSVAEDFGRMNPWTSQCFTMLGPFARRCLHLKRGEELRGVFMGRYVAVSELGRGVRQPGTDTDFSLRLGFVTSSRVSVAKNSRASSPDDYVNIPLAGIRNITTDFPYEAVGVEFMAKGGPTQTSYIATAADERREVSRILRSAWNPV